MLRVVQLARGRELARLLNRGRDAAQVGNAGNIVEPIEHLGHTDLTRPTNLRGAKVARGQRRLQTHLQNHRLDHLVNVADIDDLLEVPTRSPAAPVNLLGQTGPDVLHHLRREIGAKEVGEEETWQIHELIRIGITVIVRHSGADHPENFPGHMRQEARFCVVVGRCEANMREEL